MPTTYASIDFTPPKGVRAAFSRGIDLYEAGRGGDGLVPATISWARRLASGEDVTPAKARKGNAWHARHAVDERPGWGTPGSETPGYVAFMLWGGAPGKAWFAKLVRQMDAADKAQETTTMEDRTQNDRHLRAVEAFTALKATEAAIPLQDGESISDFASALRTAARMYALEYITTAAMDAGWDPSLDEDVGGVEDPDFRAYLQEDGLTGDTLVVEAYRDHPWTCIYLRMAYTRAEDGTFAFGAPVAVKRRTVYDEVADGPAKINAFVSTTMPGTEAVDKPTTAQRRNLPAAAYAAPFFADADGNYAPSGEFQRSKSKLPFHIRTATDVDDTATVDLPRLRNALARFDQTDFAIFGTAASTVKATARRRLDAAAKALLPSAKGAAAVGESACARLCGAPTVADVQGLVQAVEAFAVATIADRAAEALAATRQRCKAALGIDGVQQRAMTGTELAALQTGLAAIATEAAGKTLTPEAAAAVTSVKVASAALAAGRFHAVAAGA